jgi:DNA-binding transcriptional MocR family regulator
MEKLAEKFGVSRVTMLSAVKLLEAEGLLHVRQGKGTFVNPINISNVSKEVQESGNRNFTREPLGTFNEAIGHYVQFLANPQIPIEVRIRLAQVVSAQMNLFENIHLPTVNPK